MVDFDASIISSFKVDANKQKNKEYDKYTADNQMNSIWEEVKKSGKEEDFNKFKANVSNLDGEDGISMKDLQILAKKYENGVSKDGTEKEKISEQNKTFAEKLLGLFTKQNSKNLTEDMKSEAEKDKYSNDENVKTGKKYDYSFEVAGGKEKLGVNKDAYDKKLKTWTDLADTLGDDYWGGQRQERQNQVVNGTRDIDASSRVMINKVIEKAQSAQGADKDKYVKEMEKLGLDPANYGIQVQKSDSTGTESKVTENTAVDKERQGYLDKLKGTDAEKYAKYATMDDLKALNGTDEAKKKDVLGFIQYRDSVLSEIRKKDPAITDEMADSITKDIQSGKIATNVDGNAFTSAINNKVAELKKTETPKDAAVTNQTETPKDAAATKQAETEKLRSTVRDAIQKLTDAGLNDYRINNVKDNYYLAGPEDLQKILDNLKGISKDDITSFPYSSSYGQKLNNLSDIGNSLKSMNDKLYSASTKGWFSSAADITGEQKADLLNKVKSGEIKDKAALDASIQKIKDDKEAKEKAENAKSIV